MDGLRANKPKPGAPRKIARDPEMARVSGRALVNGRVSRRTRDAGERAVRIVMVIITRSMGSSCHTGAEEG